MLLTWTCKSRLLAFAIDLPELYSFFSYYISFQNNLKAVLMAHIHIKNYNYGKNGNDIIVTKIYICMYNALNFDKRTRKIF